jgi:hypothetical protein
MAEFRLGRVKFNWTGNWAPSRSYLIDDIAKFGGNTYVAVQNHTSVASTADFYATDLLKWNIHLEGLEQKGAWQPDTYYKVNDLVTFGNVVYRVVTAHTSEGTFINRNYVVDYVAGFNAEGDWNISEEYQKGDVVNYNGSSYVALTTSMAGFNPPEYIGLGTDSKWQILADGLAGAATTYQEGTYFRGDLVQYGGNIYRHTIGVTTNVSPLQVGLGTEVPESYQGTQVWDLLVTGFQFVGNFSTTYAYHPGHVVRYGSNSYLSIGASFRDINPIVGLGTYWETLAAGDSSAALNTKGDILTYNSGPFRIGIGSTGYALAVQSNGLPGYEIVGNQTRIYYVDSEDGLDTNNGLAPNLAFKTIKQACVSARPDNNITNVDYTAATGVATITSPGHGLRNVGTFIQLQNIEFECLSGGNVYNVLGMQYNSAVGLATITAIGIGAAPEVGIGATVRIRDLQVQYDVGAGATTGLFPQVHTPGLFNFQVQAVPDANSVVLNVGVSTVNYLYIQQGISFVGVTTTIFPDVVSKSYFEVLNIQDVDTIRVNVGISTINHTYISGGHLTDLTPAILKLSASQFYEQLPIVVPPFTAIIGNNLRGTQILPAEGTSDDGSTPNNRSVMFKLSDATTIQALSMKGMEGFYYDPQAPFILDNTNIRTGFGTTACGIVCALNPDSPINNKSPYVKDCTVFSDNASDYGRYGGGACGVFLDGGVHNEGAKSMVFDSFTIVSSGGAGYILDRSGISEIVSCFTYYCRWGYYSGGGSRIRSVGGNNSYGDYGVIASGFSTDESPRTARLFGDLITVQGATKDGTLSLGATMFGATSGARGWFLNDQISADKIYFKYQPGYGSVGLGTTGFVDGEIVWFGAGGDDGAGIGSISVATASSSITGQKGTILELDNVSNTLLVGDAIGLNTTGLYGPDSLYYIINTVTNVSAAVTYTYYDPVAGLSTVIYPNRASLTISPQKTVGTWDTRELGEDGSTIDVRTYFSQARLTGHDFLSVGTGNKAETNYPDVDQTQIIQGNETNVFGPGKVFFVSTDQGGNFRVGQFFSVDQLTGRATLDASAFNLSGLTELRLGAIGGQVGEAINEFSSDPFMSGVSNSACPTEAAVVGFLRHGAMGVAAMTPPVGTTAQRPGGVDLEFNTGALRFNTDIGALEYYSGSSWVAPGKKVNTVVTTSQAVNAKDHVYFVNTGGGQVTLTLPSAPDLGDSVRFFDVAKTFDTNNLIVARNGKPIQGDAADLTVSTEGAAFELTFSGDTYGWRIFSI